MNTTANNLIIGQKGVISSIKDCDLSTKLLEMNCVPGESIFLVRKAPLGDPLVLHIGEYDLSIRKSEAENISVDLV